MTGAMKEDLSTAVHILKCLFLILSIKPKPAVFYRHELMVITINLHTSAVGTLGNLISGGVVIQ